LGDLLPTLVPQAVEVAFLGIVNRQNLAARGLAEGDMYPFCVFQDALVEFDVGAADGFDDIHRRTEFGAGEIGGLSLGVLGACCAADAPVELGAAVAAGNFQGKPGQNPYLFQTLGQQPQVLDDVRTGRVIDALALRGFGIDQLLE
jgi:hypothetical protein